MVDADAVDDPVVRQLDHLLVGDLPDLGVLHPHARELADVEEAPVDACAPVEVEELGAPERVAPERVLVRRRHVVGDDVQHDSEPRVARGRRERAQLLLAAEVLRDTRRIDHVVAVRRAVPRLERGREIEMRDAERRRDTGRVARASRKPSDGPSWSRYVARGATTSRPGGAASASGPRRARSRAPGRSPSPPRPRGGCSRARAPSAARTRPPAA